MNARFPRSFGIVLSLCTIAGCTLPASTVDTFAQSSLPDYGISTDRARLVLVKQDAVAALQASLAARANPTMFGRACLRSTVAATTACGAPDDDASVSSRDPFSAAAAIARQKAADNPNDGALASAASIDADTPDVSNFHQSGKASWYGNAFHGRRTASGERYDMHEMTAAHMSLPLLSYVRVTNLLNQRSVVVRINDRGPFHGKRILDLSLAAAKALGIINRGTGNVVITGLSPSEARAGLNQSVLASR